MIKRRAGLLATMALCLFAQSSRDAYRNSYKSWRNGDSTLELDAGTAAGPTMAERTNLASGLASQYAADRAAYLSQFAAENETAFVPLENASAIHQPALSPESLQRYVANEATATDHYLQIYAKDNDAGIMQLRDALQKERASLTALSSAISERAKAAGVAEDAETVAEAARRQALDEHTDFVTAIKASAGQSAADAAVWTDYYKKVAAAAPAPPPPPPSSPAGSTSTPASVSGITVVHPADPASVPATPTPVPLVRYTGSWMYPAANGLFHGPQPVFVDLGVREEGGKATGTLFARFKTGEMRLEFSGQFANAKSQLFNAVTAEGAKGTIQLIPGPAFNLLEVNVETEPKAGKIQRANMVLVKK